MYGIVSAKVYGYYIFDEEHVFLERNTRQKKEKFAIVSILLDLFFLTEHSPSEMEGTCVKWK